MAWDHRNVAHRAPLAAALVASWLATPGCTTEPQITDQAVTVTPDTYVENRGFFVTDPPEDSPNLRRLKHYYEPPDETDRFVQHGQPLAAVVSGVRLPEDLEEAIGRTTIDAAVVLDLFTGETASESAQSLVVWYQPGATGGQMLNFCNLLVFSDDAWDSAYAPYFRIRVLDVATERNRRTRALLDEASRMASTLGPLAPTAANPVVTIAIQAAKAILGNARNKVILSYDIQFFSAEFVGQTANADIGALQQGTWLVVGRPKGATSSCWRDTLWLDRQTDQLLRTPSAKPREVKPPTPEDEQVVSVPYVRMTVATAHQVVPSIVQARAKALMDLLSSRSAGQDLDEIRDLGQKIATTAETYVVIRSARKYRSHDAMLAMVRRVLTHLDKPNLPESDVSILVAEVSRVARIPLGSGAALRTWWEDGGGSGGKFPTTGDHANQYYWEWTPKGGSDQ